MFDTKLGEFTVRYENSEEFHILKQEIFTRNCYYFETETPQPVIIDAGAHIGLATLYFKKLYPNAQIIALEPNPHTFALLEENVSQNQLTDVKLHQVALAPQASKQAFYLDLSPLHWWSTAGFIKGAWNRRQTSQEISVATQPLSAFLTQPIDLLKLDIEGIEQQVLLEAAPKLHLAQHLIIEFHPHPQQSLKRLLEFLEHHRFSVTIWHEGRETTLAKAQGLVVLEATQSHR